MSTPVITGLQPTEIVLRGGYLTGPMVLTRLRLCDGIKFCYLWKASHELARFLCKGQLRARPLAATAVFENLVKLRNDKFRELHKASMRAEEDEGDGNDEPDLAADLEVDAETQRQGPSRRHGHWGVGKCGVARDVSRIARMSRSGRALQTAAYAGTTSRL